MTEPERPGEPPGETMAERMQRMRTGDESTVGPQQVREREEPVRRPPRVARKEPGRRARERAARQAQTSRAGAGAPTERPEQPPLEVEPDVLAQRLADRLAALRSERNWSLHDLSQRTGVSRSTLSRAERGQISPTAAVLARLAAAYNQTLSGLLADVETQPRSLVRAAEQAVTGEEAWRRRTVSPPFPGLRGSVVDAQLLPGTDVMYDPAAPGAEQHVWLITGSLEVTLGAERVGRASHAELGEPGQPQGDFVLIRGDCLRLRLWGPARLRCLSPDPARYALFTVAP